MFKIKILLLVFLAFIGVGLLNPIFAYAQTSSNISNSEDRILLADHTVEHCFEENEGSARQECIDQIPEPEPEPGPVDPGTTEETEETPETCLALTFANTITFGWILCPIMSFLANLVQDMFEWVLGKSPIGGEEYCNLVVEFDDTGTTNCGTEFDRTQVQETWNAFRVLANAFFVLAFLYAIYQVAFASGNNAYLIKSMLPRLAASVVMVQLSFFFSEILINMSNEFGSYVDQLFNWVFREDDGFSLGGIIFGADDSIEDIIFNKIALAATAVLLFFSWTTILSAVGLSMLVVFLVLVARKLLILIAVVLAPLAAIAWIHPQTDGFAKAWWHTFSKLLIMYPLIIILIRSGELMARASSGTGDDAIFDLARFVAFFAPFFLIPFTFKFAGGIIGQAAGIVNNRGKGLIDRAKGVDQQRRERRKQDALADVRNARQNNYKPTVVKRFQAGLLGSSLLYGKRGAQLNEAEKTADALSTEEREARANFKAARVPLEQKKIELEAGNLDIRMDELEDSQRRFEIEAVMKLHERNVTAPDDLQAAALNPTASGVERIGAAMRLAQIQDRNNLAGALAGMDHDERREVVSKAFPDINKFAPELTGYVVPNPPPAGSPPGTPPVFDVNYSRVQRKTSHDIGDVNPDSIRDTFDHGGTEDIHHVVRTYVQAARDRQKRNPEINVQIAGAVRAAAAGTTHDPQDPTRTPVNSQLLAEFSRPSTDPQSLDTTTLAEASQLDR